MAALSQTPASVLWSSGGTIADVTFGATVVAGNALYRDTSDGLWKLAVANDTAAKSACKGIALCGGGNGQPGKVLLSGTSDTPAIVNLGATLSVGKPYILGTTAGSIYPVDDLTSTWYTTVLGVAQSSSLFVFQPVISSAAAAADVT